MIMVFYTCLYLLWVLRFSFLKFADALLLNLGECHVCGDEVKHPTDAEYKHGRLKPRFRCCGEVQDDSYDEVW